MPIGALYLYMGAVGADGSGLFGAWVARWTHAGAVTCWCLTWCVDAFEGLATCCRDSSGHPQLALCPERGAGLFPCVWLKEAVTTSVTRPRTESNSTRRTAVRCSLSLPPELCLPLGAWSCVAGVYFLVRPGHRHGICKKQHL